MPRGKYIAVDGLHSRLKTEILQALTEELETQDQPVQLMLTNAPQATPTLQALSRLTDDARYTKSPQTSLLLQSAILHEELDRIARLLETGVSCIVDHSYLASLVSEYYGQPTPLDYVQINQSLSASDLLKPDALVVLDVSADMARHTSAPTDLTKLERLRAGYLWEANQRGVAVVYDSGDLQRTLNDIWRSLAPVASKRAASKAADATIDTVASVLANRQSALVVQPKATAAHKESAMPRSYSQTVTHLEYFAALAQNNATKVQFPLYTERDHQNHYHFYIPNNLQGKLRSRYIKTMNQLFDAHADMATKLADHLMQASDMPAKKRTKAWRQTLRTEAQAYTRAVLPVASSVTITSLQQVNNTPQPGFKEPLAKLARELLPPYYTGTSEPVQLLEARPRNELEVASDLLYPLADLPYQDLNTAIAAQPYQRKVDVLAAFFEAKDWGAGLPQPTRLRYTFEFVAPFNDALELLKISRWRQGGYQPLSPRLGYDTPQLIEAAGLSDDYDACFDLSLAVHSEMQAGGLLYDAQYATLLGHKQRWQSGLDLLAVKHLLDVKYLTVPQQAMVTMICQAIGEIHPLIANYSGLNKHA